MLIVMRPDATSSDIENVLGEALVDVHLTPGRSQAILREAEDCIAKLVAQ